MLGVAIGSLIGLVPVYIAQKTSSRAMVRVWVVQVVLIIAAFTKLGIRAWTNTASFNEPGEWMVIQIIELVLAVA